jgi:hypothetical protein
MSSLKADRLAIRCKKSTKTRFREICGHFPDQESALIYLMNGFNPVEYRKGRGELL